MVVGCGAIRAGIDVFDQCCACRRAVAAPQLNAVKVVVRGKEEVIADCGWIADCTYAAEGTIIWRGGGCDIADEKGWGIRSSGASGWRAGDQQYNHSKYIDEPIVHS